MVSIENQDGSNIQFQVDKTDPSFTSMIRKYHHLMHIYEENIVNLRDIICSPDKNFVFIQFQPFATENLIDYLKKYKYSTSELFRVFFLILKGYISLYKENVIHG